MLTPNELERDAAAVRKLYLEAELLMTKKVAKRLARGITQRGWAEKKLAEVKDVRRECNEVVLALAAASKGQRQELLEKAVESGRTTFLQDAGINNGSTSAARMEAVVDVLRELDERFDAHHSAILRDVNDVYRRTIGNVVAMTATGTTTTQEAVRTSLNRFADSGIRGFTDKSGRRWNMASYAEMAVRTGMMRASLEGYKAEMETYGEDLVIITDHMDTCPLCADWERKVLSVRGIEAKHPDCDGLLDDAITAGLFHPNCLHAMTVYVPGLTDRTGMKERIGYTPEMDREGYGRRQGINVTEGYVNRQLARAAQRNVEKWERRMAVAAGDLAAYRSAKAYRDRWEKRYLELMDEHVETLKDKIAKLRHEGVYSIEELINAGSIIHDVVRSAYLTIPEVKAYNASVAEAKQAQKDKNDYFRNVVMRNGKRDRSEAVQAEFDKLGERLNEARAQKRAAFRALPSYSEFVLDSLKNIVPVGGFTKADYQQMFYDKSSPKAMDLLLDGINMYPRKWFADIFEKYKIHAEYTRGRAHCQGHYVQADGTPWTSVHELFHFVENADDINNVLAYEKEFYEYRTTGCELVRLNTVSGLDYDNSEMTRVDNFRDPYCGKAYNGDNYEVGTMGYQELLTPNALKHEERKSGGFFEDPYHTADGNRRENDVEYENWLLGLYVLTGE